MTNDRPVQRTLRRAIEICGVGLHGGRLSVVRIEPAPVDYGLRLAAAGQTPVLARAEWVTDSRLGTTLGAAAARVRTVEHWLAALTGFGLDNARLQLLEGDELPALDGSAHPIVRRLTETGAVDQPAPRRWFEVRQTVTVIGAGGAWVRLEPGEGCWLEGRYAFRRPVGEQHRAVQLDPTTFAIEIASARTFAFVGDIDRMRRQGRGLGGSLNNAVVFGDIGPLNPEGLRFPDEVVRHKLLDAVGDLALLGAPWRGRYVADRGGHALNIALVLRALRTPGVLRMSGPVNAR